MTKYFSFCLKKNIEHFHHTNNVYTLFKSNSMKKNKNVNGFLSLQKKIFLEKIHVFNKKRRPL